jgi:hypothetical protein
MIPALPHRSLRHGFQTVGVVLPTVLALAQCLFLITPARAGTEIQQDQLFDTELASIILVEDQSNDVQRKLGRPCVVPTSNHETVSYVYQSGDGSYLRFVVNASPSDVHYRLVESMTMSVQPTISMTCYTPSHVSVNEKLPRRTGKGIQLGDSLDQIRAMYGDPNDTQIVNTQEIRLQYNSGYETDQYYQWTLTFRDSHLVEWTAEAIPFFIEAGG